MGLQGDEVSQPAGPGRIVPVVLSGGLGSRLWPLSRALFPKQFLPLAGARTLIQETVDRVAGAAFAAPLVVCSEEHRFIVAEQLRTAARPPAEIILEPQGRNTAPAIAAAALRALASAAGDDVLLLVMPSDHVIGDTPAFLAAVAAGAPAAAAGHLVTFGVKPTRPETGYGYIAAGAELAAAPGVHAVDRFLEKPNRATAATLVAAGGHCWNAGIFLFGARAVLAELERHAPGIAAAARDAVAAARIAAPFTYLDAKSFAAAPAISVDHAVMERTSRAAVVPVDMAWSDVGAWDALWEIGARDAAGNVVAGDVVLHEARNSYVRAGGRLVAAIGVEDLVIVATDDAVLVVPRARAQEVKHIVERLKAEGRAEPAQHTTVHRPWGSYRTIDRGNRFQVKQIVVLPGQRLSLQMHHHRAEHWVVVEGTAKVTRGTETFLLHENESTYIPIGATHRLENPGKTPLRIIEVQSGGYLGEDDIVRFEDGYGRMLDGAR